ncbi:lipid-A-disaccharide synthase [Trichothermofontia sp.]
MTSSPQPASPLRVFISTGEVSGDLQGALLITALQQQATAKGRPIEILAMGGERMAQAGATLLADTSAIGSVGILESLPFVLPTLRAQRRVLAALKASPPDVVVLIDYLGPNLGMGRAIRQRFPGVPIAYYIAPQEWIWSLGDSNTTAIVNFTDRLLAVFPEEAHYYARKGANVTWVGHPLLDRLSHFPSRAAARAELGVADDHPLVALLPASRPQEVRYLLPVMFAAAQQLQTALTQKLNRSHAPLFWIPLSLERYRPALEAAIAQSGLRATVRSGQTETILAAADLAITKSGTVNLELALLEVPQVVLYRVSPLTAWVARHLLRFSIPFMSPPNLVAMKPIVPEFLQDQATPDAIAQESLDLLLNPERRQRMQADYRQMRSALGEVGVCDRVAQVIWELATT